MKLINIKSMNSKQARDYRICLADSQVSLGDSDALESLMKQISAIEPDMKVLGRGLNLPSGGQIDLICVDGAGRLVLVGIGESLGPSDVGAALVRAQWARTHIDMFQHMYSRRLSGGDIRLWHLARKVEPEAQAILAGMNGQGPEVFTYEGLDLGGQVWMVLRRFEAGGDGGRTAERPEGAREGASPATAAEPRPMGIRSVLTSEEIDDFFAVTGEEEEITSGGSVFKD